jgi:hypothetical protein
MLPVHEMDFKTRANHIALFLQAISSFAAEIDFVVRSFPAQLPKWFSLGEARCFWRSQ